jgi:hypothetical protein
MEDLQRENGTPRCLKQLTSKMAVTDRVISATIDESQNVFSVHACVLLQ